MTDGDYPLTFSVDYPDRPLDRLTTFFRIFTVIPILIVFAAIGGGYGRFGAASGIWLGGAGLLFIPPLLMILFRRKYPRWWLDWNRELLRFANRIYAYLALMNDRYPSTDEHQSVHLDFTYPDPERDLNRWLPLVKWFLAIPHYIVLAILWILAFFCVVIAWFAILFTGRYPRGLFGIVESVMRWGNRVTAYAFLLITDRYPPFSFE
jgi:Mn2+/Fe2+ NRAMP family transporter